MAQPTNTFDTYDAVGIREDLLDQIYNVDPDDVPFLSKMAKTSAEATKVEWQTDQLDAPADDNAHIEGDDVTHTAITPTVRLDNQTQIFRKDAVITGTAEATRRAGRGKEASYQIMLKGKAMKTDMEMSAFANQQKVGGSSSAARRLAGLPTWLTSNTDAGSGGSDATGDGSDARTDGTQAPLTEARFKAVLASIFDNSGKEADCCYMGSFNRQVASGFQGSSTRYDKGEDKSLTATVHIYEHDFGSIRFEASRHVRSRDALLVCSDMAAWADLRPMRQEELAKTGDSSKWMLIGESTMIIRNEKAFGGVFDLTTS